MIFGLINVLPIDRCPSCGKKRELTQIQSDKIRHPHICWPCLQILSKSHSTPVEKPMPLIDGHKEKVKA